jgi:hypothetical protein
MNSFRHVNTVSNGVLVTDVSRDASTLSADLKGLTRVAAFGVLGVMWLRETGLPISRRVVVMFRISYALCYMIFVIIYLLSVGFRYSLPHNLMKFTQSRFFS